MKTNFIISIFLLFFAFRLTAQPNPSCGTETLYANGQLQGFSTGNGSGGADLSTLPTTTLGWGTIGFGAQLSGNIDNMVADDFVIGGTEKWAPTKFTVFTYQTGSPTTSTITGIPKLQLWTSQPPTTGQTPDYVSTSNTITYNAWTNIYRVTETTLTNTARPIMAVTVDWPANFPDTLVAGTYWIAWQYSGSLASGPWAAPAGTGNAKQLVGDISLGTYTWNNAVDGGTGTVPQAFPFRICGVNLAVDAGADQTICAGFPVTLNGSGGCSVKTWSTAGDGNFSDVNLSNSTYTPGPTDISNGSVVLTYSGCGLSDDMTLTVSPFALSVSSVYPDTTSAAAVITPCTGPYNLYWRKLVIGSSWMSAMGLSGNTHTMTGLSPASSYIAYAMDANGETTSLTYFTTSGTSPCSEAAPSNLSATVDCNQVSYSWTGASPSYVTYIRKITPSLGGASSVVTSGTSRVYTIPVSGYGETYEISVQGKCGSQYTPSASPIYVNVTDPRPASPGALTFSATCNSITTNWSAAPGAIGYFVRIKNMITNSISANVYTTNTSYTKSGLSSNFSYEVWVVPVGCNNLRGSDSYHYSVQTCSGSSNLMSTRYQTPDLSADIIEPVLSIYPNPNNGFFTFSMSNTDDESRVLEVLNSIGQVVYTQSVKSENGELTLEVKLEEALPEGTYLVKVTHSDGSHSIQKFIKL